VVLVVLAVLAAKVLPLKKHLARSATFTMRDASLRAMTLEDALKNGGGLTKVPANPNAVSRSYELSYPPAASESSVGFNVLRVAFLEHNREMRFLATNMKAPNGTKYRVITLTVKP